MFVDLGFEARFVQSRRHEYGRHLFLTRKGRSPRKIGLISHLDTVYTEEEEAANDFSWRREGNKIYGPGTIDIKGGTLMILMLLEALRTFSPELFEAFTWEVMLDASEEDDARDFGELCLETLGDDAVACLVFELGLVTDEKFLLVVARKGRAIFHIKVEGRAAHAGSAHPLGANAILQLAELVQTIESWTDYEKDLTFCVGTIAGGTVTNRVPHFAESKVEMRAFSREVFDEAKARMLAFNDYSSVSNAVGDFDCKVTVEIERMTGPWPKEASTVRLYEIWERAGATLGLRAVPQERGGLSDANLISHAVAVMDGLGPSGDNAHCSQQSADGSREQEYLDVTSLTPKAILNTLGLMELIQSELDAS
jgi:glutamate carboxypeptidase